MKRAYFAFDAISFPNVRDYRSWNLNIVMTNQTKHEFIEMKEKFIQVVMLAKEAHSLGSLSITEGAHAT